MFNTVYNTPKLIAHKEGKLKSYESCFDVRAWGHDDNRRSSYLRDWIRRDLPVCVLPVLAVTRCLRTMTRRRRIPLPPPCRPECRSKNILDNISKSCQAIKECLKTEGEFQKFFENEEFETCHWPCERCVEILKSIKLFWNIIVEKLLNITFATNDDFDDTKTKSIDKLAEQWKDKIVEQTLQVKNLQCSSSTRMGIHTKESQKSNVIIINRQGKRSNDHIIYNDLNKKRKIYKDVATSTDFLHKNGKIKHATKSQNVCASVEKSDISCNTSFKSLTYLSKKDLMYLKKRLDMQETKIKQLENENSALRLKLKNKIKDDPSDSTNIVVSDSSTDLKTIDDYSKDQFETIKDIASEMIITLKNCTNKSFRNISVLQVLHKSNITSTEAKDHLLDDKNPIDVLNRVHETFNAIVRRELCIAKNNKNYRVEKTRTSFHKMDSISVSTTSSSSKASKFESVEGL